MSGYDSRTFSFHRQGGVSMAVYLLHFQRPISAEHTTQHYLGYTQDLVRRIEEHRAGRGSRLCEVAKEREIPFVLVRVWIGGRRLERQLKRRKNGPKLCPICHQPVADHLLSFDLCDVTELSF